MVKSCVKVEVNTLFLIVRIYYFSPMIYFYVEKYAYSDQILNIKGGPEHLLKSGHVRMHPKMFPGLQL